MGRFVDWIQAFALALGGPGLFLVAFLDSSFLSLPEINDLLLIWMVTQHKSRMLLLRGLRDARLDRRLPRAVLRRPEGRRVGRAGASAPPASSGRWRRFSGTA